MFASFFSCFLYPLPALQQGWNLGMCEALMHSRRGGGVDTNAQVQQPRYGGDGVCCTAQKVARKTASRGWPKTLESKAVGTAPAFDKMANCKAQQLRIGNSKPEPPNTALQR